MHQTHEFASSEHEGALVLILGDLILLAPVESLVLQVELPELMSAQDEVVTTMRIADLGYYGLSQRIGIFAHPRIC